MAHTPNASARGHMQLRDRTNFPRAHYFSRTNLCSSQTRFASRILVTWVPSHRLSRHRLLGLGRDGCRSRRCVTACAKDALNFCWCRPGAGAGFFLKAGLSRGLPMPNLPRSKPLKRLVSMGGWSKFHSPVTSGAHPRLWLHRKHGRKGNRPIWNQSLSIFVKCRASNHHRNRIEIPRGFQLKRRSNGCSKTVHQYLDSNSLALSTARCRGFNDCTIQPGSPHIMCRKTCCKKIRCKKSAFRLSPSKTGAGTTPALRKS